MVCAKRLSACREHCAANLERVYRNYHEDQALSRVQNAHFATETTACGLFLESSDATRHVRTEGWFAGLWHLQTAGDSSLMDDSIGPGGVRGGPSFRTMSKQDYLLLYGGLRARFRV